MDKWKWAIFHIVSVRIFVWLSDTDYTTLKGLGHAILSNFSTDQMVMELTKIWK